MTPLGTIVVDEFIFPIVRIELRHGAILITGQAIGPCRGVSTDGYIINGADGHTVFRARGRSASRIAWAQIPPGARWEFTAWLQTPDYGYPTEARFPPSTAERLDEL